MVDQDVLVPQMLPVHMVTDVPRTKWLPMPMLTDVLGPRMFTDTYISLPMFLVHRCLYGKNNDA